jgi:hypothetical protein
VAAYFVKLSKGAVRTHPKPDGQSRWSTEDGERGERDITRCTHLLAPSRRADRRGAQHLRRVPYAEPRGCDDSFKVSERCPSARDSVRPGGCCSPRDRRDRVPINSTQCRTWYSIEGMVSNHLRPISTVHFENPTDAESPIRSPSLGK